MKLKLLLLTGALTFLFSCKFSNDKFTPEQVVKEYFKGLNNHGFNEISPYIADSIMTLEGDYLLSRTFDEFYVLFQWDSVFLPHYELIEIKTVNNKVEATVSKTCKRIQYLHDTAIVYKVMVDVADNQIVSVQTNEYIVFDFEKWQTNRDTLVAWIDNHHPDLSGFVNDQTTTGAQNYLKAIDLFRDGN